MERTGWWLKNLNHHPVGADSDASLFLFTGADTPPGQEGQSNSGFDFHLRRRHESLDDLVDGVFDGEQWESSFRVCH